MRTGLGCFAVAALVEASVLGFVHPVSIARAGTRAGSSATARFGISANVVSHCEVAAPSAIAPTLLQRAVVEHAISAPLVAFCASGISPVIAVRTAAIAVPNLGGHTTQRHQTIEGRSLAVLTITY